MALMQHRGFAADAALEIVAREDDPDAMPRIRGYVTRFNVWSLPIFGMYKEMISSDIEIEYYQGDALALRQHRYHEPLGRRSSGTLEIQRTDDGLLMTVDPVDAEYARAHIASIRRRDITGSSFGFIPDIRKDEWLDPDPEDGLARVVTHGMTFIEGSPGVSLPAYPQTTVDARGQEALLQRGITWREVPERFLLRDAPPVETPPVETPPQRVVDSGALRRELELADLALRATTLGVRHAR